MHIDDDDSPIGSMEPRRTATELARDICRKAEEALDNCPPRTGQYIDDAMVASQRAIVLLGGLTVRLLDAINTREERTQAGVEAIVGKAANPPLRAYEQPREVPELTTGKLLGNWREIIDDTGRLVGKMLDDVATSLGNECRHDAWEESLPNAEGDRSRTCVDCRAYLGVFTPKGNMVRGPHGEAPAGARTVTAGAPVLLPPGQLVAIERRVRALDPQGAGDPLAQVMHDALMLLGHVEAMGRAAAEQSEARAITSHLRPKVIKVCDLPEDARRTLERARVDVGGPFMGVARVVLDFETCEAHRAPSPPAARKAPPPPAARKR